MLVRQRNRERWMFETNIMMIFFQIFKFRARDRAWGTQISSTCLIRLVYMFSYVSAVSLAIQQLVLLNPGPLVFQCFAFKDWLS